jgi:hypothetical protein
LEAVAYDHLDMGKIVVLDAPLAPELNDAGWVARIRGECARRAAGFLPVWVSVSPATAFRRMQARGEGRDRWKLDHWAEFLARQSYDHPAHAALVLNNEKDDAAGLDAGIERLRKAIAATSPIGRPSHE